MKSVPFSLGFRSSPSTLSIQSSILAPVPEADSSAEAPTDIRRHVRLPESRDGKVWQQLSDWLHTLSQPLGLPQAFKWPLPHHCRNEYCPGVLGALPGSCCQTLRSLYCRIQGPVLQSPVANRGGAYGGTHSHLPLYFRSGKRYPLGPNLSSAFSSRWCARTELRRVRQWAPTF